MGNLALAQRSESSRYRKIFLPNAVIISAVERFCIYMAALAGRTIVTHIRDPMDPFWSLLTKRYRTAARLLYLQSRWPLGDRYEDLAQDTLIKTIRFVEQRREKEGDAFAITKDFLEECVRHGRTCMENQFVDEIRKARRRRFNQLSETDFTREIILVVDGRNSSDTKAIALSWVKDMRRRSKRGAFQRMLTAFAELVEEGFPDISLKDVAHRAGASHNDVYRFKQIVQNTRDELTAKGQSL